MGGVAEFRDFFSTSVTGALLFADEEDLARGGIGEPYLRAHQRGANSQGAQKSFGAVSRLESGDGAGDAQYWTPRRRGISLAQDDHGGETSTDFASDIVHQRVLEIGGKGDAPVGLESVYFDGSVRERRFGGVQSPGGSKDGACCLNEGGRHSELDGCFPKASSRNVRKSSATLQAWAIQPPGRCGESPS